jgi:hypothetical protein
MRGTAWSETYSSSKAAGACSRIRATRSCARSAVRLLLLVMGSMRPNIAFNEEVAELVLSSAFVRVVPREHLQSAARQPDRSPMRSSRDRRVFVWRSAATR